MKLPDIMTGPWALVPERLMELQEIYARHVRGEAADLAAITDIVDDEMGRIPRTPR